MNPPLVARSVVLRPWLLWTAGFVAFPIAGLAGTAVAGRVDSPAAALTAGLIVGAVIGAAQSLTASGRLHHLRWITATTPGMGLGLLVGAAAVEMQYQFDEPFIVDSSRITAHLGVHATPLDQAVADTLATYRTPAPAPARRA